jgi:hypothetical protein
MNILPVFLWQYISNVKQLKQRKRKCFAVFNDCSFFGKGGTKIKTVATFCVLFFVHFGLLF